MKDLLNDLKEKNMFIYREWNRKNRYPFNSIACVLDATNYKVVIIGGLDSDEKVELERSMVISLKNGCFLQDGQISYRYLYI